MARAVGGAHDRAVTQVCVTREPADLQRLAPHARQREQPAAATDTECVVGMTTSTKSRHTNVRLPAPLHERVERFAQDERRSLSNTIRLLIERGLERESRRERAA